MILVVPVFCLILTLWALAQLLVQLASLLQDVEMGAVDYVQTSGLLLLSAALSVLIVYLVMLTAHLS